MNVSSNASLNAFLKEASGIVNLDALSVRLDMLMAKLSPSPGASATQSEPVNRVDNSARDFDRDDSLNPFTKGPSR